MPIIFLYLMLVAAIVVTVSSLIWMKSELAVIPFIISIFLEFMFLVSILHSYLSLRNVETNYEITHVQYLGKGKYNKPVVILKNGKVIGISDYFDVILPIDTAVRYSVIEFNGSGIVWGHKELLELAE